MKHSVDNRGSGMITVLVSIVMIAALGASLLFLSYSAYQIRMAERGGKLNFYNTEDAMNHVRIAVQNAATVAIREAYADVLSRYSETTDHQDAFAKAFVQSLVKCTPEKIDPNKEHLQTQTGNWDKSIFDMGEMEYNLSYLNIFGGVEGVVLEEKGSITIRYYTITKDDGMELQVPESVTLDNVVLHHYQNGYETRVDADIVIRVPDFAYVVPEYMLTVVYDYTTVASGGLVVDGNAAVVGDCYFGGITVNTGGRLALPQGRIISGGEVKLENNAVFTDALTDIQRQKIADMGYTGLPDVTGITLWARNILLNTEASLHLTGDTYVNNDLNLSGDKASVTLGGYYNGFGRSETDDSQSSAILVNGKDCKLNFNDIEQLMLAGYSFINVGRYDTVYKDSTDSGNGNGGINLGNALSVKSDQTVFLAPVELLDYGESGYAGNPYIMPDGEPYKPELNTGAPLFGIDTKNLESYGEVTPRTLSWLLPSNNDFRIVYTFLDFPSPQAAALYFADYFAAYPERIGDYLQTYISALTGLRDANVLQATGNVYTRDEDGLFSLLASGNISTIESQAERQKAQYDSLCTDLTYGSLPDDTTTPFNTLVDDDKFKDLTTNEIRWFDLVTDIKEDNRVVDSKRKTVALVVNNRKSDGGTAFVIDADFLLNHVDKTDALDIEGKDVAVIIASGDVRVEADFSGLILCDGTLTLAPNVTLIGDKSRITAAFTDPAYNSDDSENDELMHYMKSDRESSTDETVISWDLATVVVYNHWSKNREG